MPRVIGPESEGPADARRILIAVSGGIAAYKVPELVRQLTKAGEATARGGDATARGHEIRCVMTANAANFVTPLVLQTLTGAPVRSDLFDLGEESEIGHIALADWAEIVVVAPATANLLAKMCHGLADDAVSAILLATRAKLLVAPAMNVNMWQHPATRANVDRLRERGVRIVGPEAGELACGWEGEGRMAEPRMIAEAVELELGPGTLAGRSLLVAAGGTREPIDSVRSVANRSSGKMGFAIAAEAARRGANVALVAGPVALPTPAGVRRIDVGSALEMREAVLRELDAADIVVKAAAVADFRPVDPKGRKIKKEDLADGEGLTIELERTPDILAEICARKDDRIVIGFAAESHDVIEAARRKLARKGCDLLVVNDVSRTDAGFDVDTNAVSFVWPGGEVEELPLLPKSDVASALLDRAEKLHGSQA